MEMNRRGLLAFLGIAPVLAASAPLPDTRISKVSVYVGRTNPLADMVHFTDGRGGGGGFDPNYFKYKPQELCSLLGARWGGDCGDSHGT